MRKVHNISQRIFWIKLPTEEMEIWQNKAKNAGYDNLQEYVKSVITDDKRIEQLKLSLKQDYDVKIEQLINQNNKLKLQVETLILVLNKYQKLSPHIKRRLNTINSKITESGYTPEQWDRMIEEEIARECENKVLEREWKRLSNEQKMKAYNLMSWRKHSLPEALKRVSKKFSKDFKEMFP